VRATEPFLALSLILAASPAAAAESARFDIPAGRLSDALIALAEQGGITIGTGDPGLAAVRSRSLRGRMSMRDALARLLAGTGYTYEYVGSHSVRILRTAAPARARHPSPQPRPATAPPELPPQEIIVTGSKLGTSLDWFAGTVDVVDLAPVEIGRFGLRGSEAIVDRLPILASTNLGPGRNKIYLRGIADSSFNGPSASVVGQYLGDVRLTYNAPDPDVLLYDVDRVEVLEGPQGTLYGSGSLGGILRLVPNPPDPGAAASAVTAGVLTTQHGGRGGDLSGMINLPLAQDRLALRVVGYLTTDGGYIDDLGRGRTDVNRNNVHGGRATLLWEVGGGWRFEAGTLLQYISNRDGQYSLRGLPRLTRTSALAQPFDNDYRLGHVTLRKRWANAELVSATGIVRHSLDSRFDATGFPGTTGPQLFNENVEITLLSHETRLSQPDARGEGWLAGFSLLRDISRIRRTLGPPADPQPISGVRNAVTEAALFGQYSLAPAEGIGLTVGARLNLARSAGRPIDAPEGRADEPRRTDVRLLPTAAATWRPAPQLLVYARFQRGFRAGGLAVHGTDSVTSFQRFESDSLTSYEAGLRYGRSNGPLRLEAALSYARWADMQADLIDARGLPFTANIGDGRIRGLEAKAWWQATPRFGFEAAMFLNRSHLTSPNPPFAGADDRDLPNIAGDGLRAAAHWQIPLSPTLSLGIDGVLRYVGESKLDVSQPLNLDQGGYAEARLGARLDFGRVGLSLDIDNFTDTRGNRFSFGNPFGVADGLQITPLRPRTVRIGVDAAF
jgi:outer membrane receptor protein involved in Fe transport